MHECGNKHNTLIILEINAVRVGIYRLFAEFMLHYVKKIPYMRDCRKAGRARMMQHNSQGQRNLIRNCLPTAPAGVPDPLNREFKHRAGAFL